MTGEKNVFRNIKFYMTILTIILGSSLYFVFSHPNGPLTDILKTLIGTLLGGLLSVFVTLQISTYNVKQKSALDRKENIYMPIDKELKEIIKQQETVGYWGSLNQTFEFPKIDELLENSYVFLPKKLKKSLLQIKEFVNELKTINHYSIANDIILENFESALKHFYGNKGFEDYEDSNGILQYDFPSPYKVLKRELNNHKNIDYIVGDNFFEVIELYGSILNGYKEPLINDVPQEIQEERRIDVVEFIVQFYSGKEEVLENEQIGFKRSIYTDIIAEINNAIQELSVIFTYIHNKYEEDTY